MGQSLPIVSLSQHGRKPRFVRSQLRDTVLSASHTATTPWVPCPYSCPCEAWCLSAGCAEAQTASNFDVIHVWFLRVSNVDNYVPFAARPKR